MMMMMMSSNNITTSGAGNGLNDPKFANWNNRFQKILQKSQGLHRFQKLYTELNAKGGLWLTATQKAAEEIRGTYEKPTQVAIEDINKLKLALKDMTDGTVDDATNQKILEENSLTQYKDTKFTKDDVQKIAKESLEAWKEVDKRRAEEVNLRPERKDVKEQAQSLITTKNKLLKELQYGTDGKSPVVNVSTDAVGKQIVTPLYDENVIDPTVALKVTRLQQLMTALAPYEQALKSNNQDAAIDELLKPKQEAIHAFAEKLKTTKDSYQYRGGNWLYGKPISKANGFDEIFDENLPELNQLYASISGANVDRNGNLVGGFLKAGKSGTISEKEASFSLDELEGLSISRNGKPIVTESFKDNKNYVEGPELKSKEGVTAKIWLPKDETVEASEGITFNEMPVIITKDANGKLLARVVDITKAGNGTTITQMPLNFDPKKAKGEDGKYKTKLTIDDMLPPNKGESVRLFTTAFNSLGEPQGNVIMTPSPKGLPRVFNELPGIIQAKITASSYADPITFPPATKLTAEQTSLTTTYNNDLALLQGVSAPPMVATQPAPATTQQQAQPQQQPMVQQPIFPAPQLPQQPQLTKPLAQAVQPTIPQNYIAPAVQPTGVVAGSVSTPVPQPVQPVAQPIIIAPAVAPVAQPTTVTPSAPATTAPVAPRKWLAQPDLWNYTTHQLNQQTKALGWE